MNAIFSEQWVKEYANMEKLDTEISLVEELTNFKSSVLNNYNPAKRLPDSAMVYSVNQINNSSRILIEILPASHFDSFSNDSYLFESELLLGNVEIGVNTQTGNAFINHISFFSSHFYPRFNDAGKSLSNSIELSYRSLLDDFSTNKHLVLEYGKGMTFGINSDIDAFFMLKTGVGFGLKNSYANLKSEFGVFYRVTNESKLKAISTYNVNTQSNLDDSSVKEITYSVQHSDNFNSRISAKRLTKNSKSDNAIELSIAYLF